MTLLLFGSRPRQHNPPPERSPRLIQPRRVRSPRGRGGELLALVGTTLVEPSKPTALSCSTALSRVLPCEEVSEDVQEDLHQEQMDLEDFLDLHELEEIQEDECAAMIKQIQVQCAEELHSWRSMMMQEVGRITGMVDAVREEATALYSEKEEGLADPTKRKHKRKREARMKTKLDAKQTGEQSEDEDYEETLEEKGEKPKAVAPPRKQTEAERLNNLNLVDRVFAIYATWSRGHGASSLQKGHLWKFASDLKKVAPGAHSWYKSKWLAVEEIFDDTEGLQHRMSSPGSRCAAGLTLEWFRVFVQKVVSRVGAEFTGCFQIVLSS